MVNKRIILGFLSTTEHDYSHLIFFDTNLGSEDETALLLRLKK